MANVHYVADIKVAWWVTPYIQSVQLFARIFGLQPDPYKVGAVVRSGVKVRVRAVGPS